MIADCYTKCRKIKVRKLYYPKIAHLLHFKVFITFNLSLTFLYKLTKSPKCICLMLSISNTTAHTQALYQFRAESVQ